MSKQICPGQDTRYWRPGDIFEVTCGGCGVTLEFFKDEATRKCPQCGTRIKNPHLALGCAQWCEHAQECLGFDLKAMPGDQSILEAEERSESMEATEVLVEEHRAIKRVLTVLRQAARDISDGKQHSPEVFEQAVDFIRNFADRCHHLKEENILFKEMEKKGIPAQGGPIGVMLLEHEKGRALARGMAEAIPGYAHGVAQARQALADQARGYANLLAQHIDKEDNILYPMANQRLTEKDQASLLARFEQMENEEMGPGVHEHYHELIAKLEILVLGHAHEETRHPHP